MKLLKRIAPTAIVLAAVVLIAATYPVIAQSQSGQPADGQAVISYAKPSNALASALENRDWEWKYGPLAFTAAHFVTQPSASYGTFETRPSNTFAAGETLRIYVEPVGFAYGRDEGAHLIDFTTDIEIEIPSGQLIVSQTDFARLSARSGKPIREFSANLALDISALKPSEYILTVVFRDLHSSKSAAATLPFTVVGPVSD